MANATEYNGWKNKATWNVSLHVFNDESVYRAMQERKTRPERKGKFTAGQARAFCRAMYGDRTPDGLSMARVDWKAIAEAFNDE
jgi:hypothetical protein